MLAKGGDGDEAQAAAAEANRDANAAGEVAVQQAEAVNEGATHGAAEIAAGAEAAATGAERIGDSLTHDDRSDALTTNPAGSERACKSRTTCHPKDAQHGTSTSHTTGSAHAKASITHKQNSEMMTATTTTTMTTIPTTDIYRLALAILPSPSHASSKSQFVRGADMFIPAPARLIRTSSEKQWLV